jgi:RimJ/RimL family protein N-acetyltransferase
VVGEVWLNFSVRRAADEALLGFLQATVHHDLAEVAFLFGSRHWGQGYATEGLLWLGPNLLAREDCRALWATTVPANSRSRALLLRCGYKEATAERPCMLETYDDGDLVYRGPSR